jgi:hypothetical protein
MFDPAAQYCPTIIENARRQSSRNAAICWAAILLASSELDGAEFLDPAQSVRLIASAEKYYRIMYYGGALEFAY